MGARVCGYALDPETDPNLFGIARIGTAMQDMRADIRDYAALQSAMSGFAPEVVFHLAAQPLVRRSYQDPLSTYATNVMGTANVLEAVRNAPRVRAVVCITTDKCYENREWVWPYREPIPWVVTIPMPPAKPAPRSLSPHIADRSSRRNRHPNTARVWPRQGRAT